MTTDNRTKLFETAEWALRLITPIAAVTAAVGMIYLRSEFLPRVEFEEYRKENTAILTEQIRTLNGIEKTLAVMAETSKRYDRQDTRIDTLETRLLNLERVPIDKR